MEKLQILGFAGSLRTGSYNKMLLKTAKEMAPDDMEIEIFDLEGIPLFNQDLENQPVERVKDFKEKIKSADGLLMAVPEYNYSVSGVLKNAIDAASRPYGTSPFDGKPGAIMGASTGMLGSSRAQYHLRQSLTALNVLLLNRPEVMVTFAEKKFDSTGRLIDEPTRELVYKLLLALKEWVIKFK